MQVLVLYHQNKRYLGGKKIKNADCQNPENISQLKTKSFPQCNWIEKKKKVPQRTAICTVHKNVN